SRAARGSRCSQQLRRSCIALRSDRPARAIAVRHRDVPVSRLTLTDFRSYASAQIEPGPGFVLLYGENGAGKTNVLEAVSLLTPGRGLRGAALSEMARTGGSGAFAVAAQLSPSAEGQGITIGTGTQSAAPERRQVRINGAPASVNRLSEW